MPVIHCSHLLMRGPPLFPQQRHGIVSDRRIPSPRDNAGLPQLYLSRAKSIEDPDT